MKLLLTSNGLSNRSIANSLRDLVGKIPGETKIAYVPTAAIESGSKDWLVKNLLNLWRFGYSWIDVVDPSAADSDWQNRLAAVDIIYISGGNTFHLLNQCRKTGFDKWLNENLGGRVYIGESASTILATPTIELAGLPPGDANLPGLKDLVALNWVDFEVMPHCGQQSFEAVEKYSVSKSQAVYGLDDLSAIKVDGDKIEVISEGSWKLYEPK